MAATMIRARPTLYKGIQMRSRLEAKFASYLDAAGLDWAYEPECFADETGQYLPDFLIRNVSAYGSGKPVALYVELKPTFLDPEGWRQLVAKLEIIWSSKPDAALCCTIQGRWTYRLPTDGRGDDWLPAKPALCQCGALVLGRSGIFECPPNSGHRLAEVRM